jgi:hypothetical protein
MEGDDDYVVTSSPVGVQSEQSVSPNLLPAQGILEDNNFALDNLFELEDGDGWSVLTTWLDPDGYELTALRSFQAAQDGAAATALKANQILLEVNRSWVPPTTDSNGSLIQLSGSISADGLTGSTARFAVSASPTNSSENGTVDIQRSRGPSLVRGMRKAVCIYRRNLGVSIKRALSWSARIYDLGSASIATWHQYAKHLLSSQINVHLECVFRALGLALSVLWMYLHVGLLRTFFRLLCRCHSACSWHSGRRGNPLQLPWDDFCCILLSGLLASYVMTFALKMFNVSVPHQHFVIFAISVALLELAVDAVFELR